MEEELPRLNELQQKELNMLVEGLGGWDEDTCPEPVYIKHPDALGTHLGLCQVEHTCNQLTILGATRVREGSPAMSTQGGPADANNHPAAWSLAICEPASAVASHQLLHYWRAGLGICHRYVGARPSPSSSEVYAKRRRSRCPYISTVKLLVTLTMPLPRTVGERVRNEHLSWMQEAKEGFAHKHVMVAIMTFLAKPLMDRHEEHNNNLIELVLTLFRNLLLIPDGNPSPTASSTDYRAHLHDRLVLLFHSVCRPAWSRLGPTQATRRPNTVRWRIRVRL